MAIIEHPVPYAYDGKEFEGMLVYDDGVSGKRPAIFMQPDWLGVCTHTVEMATEALGDADFVMMVADMFGLEGWNAVTLGASVPARSVQDWVEKKIRRHLMRARKLKGFGWKRWSKRWLYEGLGPYNNYRLRGYEPRLKASPVR